MVVNNLSIYDELSARITESPKFGIYYDLVGSEILRSLNSSSSTNELTFNQIRFLLESASILACSSNDEHKQFAYYIVVLVYNQYREYYEKLSSIVELIFIRLGNFPAYTLFNRIYRNNEDDIDAKDRIIFDVEDVPFPLLHESLIKKELNTIRIDGQERVLTDFQTELFNELRNNNAISCSAPTSAGKSFLLALYVVSVFKEYDKFNIVYIVPTKALISQVKRDLKNNLLEFGITNVEVLSSTTTFELELVDRSKIDKCILILTQERLSYLLGSKEIDFPIDVLLIDEAQKVSDGSRGVILERTIISALRHNIATKIVFSSPLASNPEFFQVYKPEVIPIKTNYSPVAQNIIFINSKKKRDFLSALFENKQRVLIPSSELVQECPKGGTAKVAYWTYQLGKGKSNIIYRNRPTDTERLAENICEYLPDVKHKKIGDFIQYIREEVHSEYSLISCLKKGVVFHYSTMPREIKDKVEELFADEEIPVQYLCCTSTLLEGMNLPATNIFIHKPQKGVNKNMQMFDFWNLAGRAGRLMKDFYGNIFCIDVDEWEGYIPESTIENYMIESATEDSISKKTEDIIRYLDNAKEPFPEKERELLEQTSSTFVMDYIENEQQTVEKFVKDRGLSLTPESIERISTSVRKIVAENKLPLTILEKNPGIDTRLQNELYEYFTKQFYLTLIPKHPASGTEFYYSLLNIYEIIDNIFLNGSDSKILGRYAVLSSQWINEEPLSTLIQHEINYLKDKDKFTSVNSCVRSVVQTIENTLTYKYAKYLKCYSDILDYHLVESGHDVPHIRRLPANLELGAIWETTISLLTFGLSRTTAIRLRKLIGLRDLNRTECKEWLVNYYDRTKSELPMICQEDFERNIR